ncbi:hypothetical protein [Oligoflexus tunisiensis]|uniref:hypothetical protein n=1 Tax=Oligoflexus tunisiensis TaxID=708132 RepID=UPI00114D1C99|nr:hypothetical protein [Oligoflexus tunisiensis]
MKQNLIIIVFMLLASAIAQAQSQVPTKPRPARFSLQLPVLKYTTSTVEANGASEKVNELTTQALDDGFIGITHGKIGLYIFPFDDGNHFVSIGYMITNDIELGADIGLNQTASSDSTLFGGWGVYYTSWGSLDLEHGASFSLSSRTDKNPPNPDSKSSETSIKISETIVYPLARNLRYFGGAFIRNKSGEANGAKTSAFQIGFILAGLRIKWL